MSLDIALGSRLLATGAHVRTIHSDLAGTYPMARRVWYLQIAVMMAVLFAAVALFGHPLRSWVANRPHHPALVSAMALAAGGAYFLFYWGIAPAWPALGRWGLQRGWYS